MTKLGRSSRLVFSTEDLVLSKEFYSKIGFDVIENDSTRYPESTFSDGMLLISVRMDGAKKKFIEYCSDDPQSALELLDEEDIQNDIHFLPGEDAIEYLKFTGAYRMNVEVLNTVVSGYSQSENISTLIEFWKKYENDPETLLPDGIENSALGFFTEFSQTVNDAFTGINYWQKLGFEVLTQQTEPYNWGTVTDGLNILGFHQSGSQENPPALTYMAKGMDKKIERLKSNGLNVKSFTDGTMMITSPEGMNFMLFDLGG